MSIKKLLKRAIIILDTHLVRCHTCFTMSSLAKKTLSSILIFSIFFLSFSTFLSTPAHGTLSPSIPREPQGKPTTTIYFGSHQKALNDQGEIVEEKTYLSLPHITLLKTKTTGSQQPSLVGGTQTLVANHYLFQDNLSSTRVVTDDTGNKVEEYDYYPYGSHHQHPASSQPSAISDRLYTSQTIDPSTSLYYYHARYYNPTTAHFISADKAEGPNRYSYVAGNPINRNDPSGNVVEGSGGVGPFGYQNPLYMGRRVSTEANNLPFLQEVGIGLGAGLVSGGVVAGTGVVGSYGLTGIGMAAESAYLGLTSLYVKGSITINALKILVLVETFNLYSDSAEYLKIFSELVSSGFQNCPTCEELMLTVIDPTGVGQWLDEAFALLESGPENIEDFKAAIALVNQAYQEMSTMEQDKYWELDPEDPDYFSHLTHAKFLAGTEAGMACIGPKCEEIQARYEQLSLDYKNALTDLQNSQN